MVNEHLVADACAELGELFAFLGVNSEHRPEAMATRHNTTEWKDIDVSPDTLHGLLDYCRSSNRRLARLFGCDVRHWDEPSPAIERMLG